MRVRSLLVLLAAAAIVGACGGGSPPEQPAPAPVDSSAIDARQDSIDAANRAREAAERAARDSAEAARLAAEAAARDGAALMTDMAAMIHFGYDQAEIMSSDMANLDRKAAILNANSGLQIRISGHADERGSDEYNLALGNRRAAAAKRYLVNQGAAEAQISIASFGEERPIAMGGDEDSWAQNRRDEFEITAGGETLVAPN